MGRVVAALDLQAEQLRKLAALKASAWHESEEALRRCLDVEIPGLCCRLQEVVQSRETMEDRIFGRLGAAVAELQEAMLAEATARVESEEALLEMCDEVAT